MIYAPSHIKKYAKQIQGENKYFRDGIYGEVTFAYEISCNCGNKEFVVYKNSEPKVIAFCTSCGKQITLYDLIEYPCATTARDPEEKLEKIINKSNDKFNVAIIIQYSDQFAFNDERFDENDITWCQIFLYDIVNLQSIMISGEDAFWSGMPSETKALRNMKPTGHTPAVSLRRRGRRLPTATIP